MARAFVAAGALVGPAGGFGGGNALAGWSWRLRKMLPRGAKRPLRVARLVGQRYERPPRIPAELWAECRVAPSRHELIAQLPRKGRVAEIGTDAGRFALRILKASKPRELHVVDIDLSRLLPAVAANPRVVLHESDSAAAIAGFADASFDWIYIDGDHSLGGALRDAEAAAPKVRPGGYLVFNDFAHIDRSLSLYGVHSAVMRFVARHRWPIAWLAYQRDGLYDIALRRPATAGAKNHDGPSVGGNAGD